MPRRAASRLHADRAAGGDRDHRRADRPAAAGGPGGAGGGAAGPVLEQPQADRPGAGATTSRPSGPCRCRWRWRARATPWPTTPAGAPRPGSCPYLEGNAAVQRGEPRRLQGGPGQLHGRSASRGRLPLPERGQARGLARTTTALSGVVNYGFCQGRLVRLGRVQRARRTARRSGPNRSRRLAEFTDGLSHTLFAAEVKAYQAASNCRFTTLPSVNDPNNIPGPDADPFAVAPEYDNGALRDPEPVRVPHRVVRRPRPRRRVHHGLAAQQGDPRAGRPTRGWTSTSTAGTRRTAGRPSRRSRPGATTPAGSTPCSATARSGSSRARSTGRTWRALGTVAGGEVVGPDPY